MRRREDEEDIALAAYNSFCKGQRQNQFVINDRKALKSLVLAITYRKLCQVVEFHSVASRDYHREGPMFSESSPRDGASSSQVLLDVIPSPRSPQEIEAELDEILELVYASLTDSRLQELFQFWLAGESPDEIAERLGLSKRTVYRGLERIREKLKGLELEL